MTVFADTSALYALLVGTEERHAEVVGAMNRLLASNRAIVTSNYVLLETTALLQRRVGLAAARDLDQAIVPLCHVRWVDEDIHQRALTRLWRTDRRGVSLVDCTSFELMEREGIRHALTLDADFAEAGFTVSPPGPQMRPDPRREGG